MKKRKISLPLLLGVCLILGSLCVFAVFGIWQYTLEQTCRQAVLKLEEALHDVVPGVPGMSGGMPVMQVEGVDYAALLEVPTFGIKLPVADEWDGQSLAGVPARFYGSAYDGTLVIGGSDTAYQFGFCDQIQHGSAVTVTDMTGSRFSYTVTRIDRAKHAESGWLADEDFDLTIFCRDTYTLEYIAVRCNYSYK